ncbi:GNAT family N-acetyltransferase [Gottfriedia sp. NPDC056225]|uniref:GNAT family N-acetyltransferase n=1 Tax=Gottfriedia sp. NPDC056225 TaxID=3345751 RepID=UPI0035DD0EB6
MQLSIREMTASYAIEIVNWRYVPPYDFYNIKSGKEELDELLNNQYKVIIDQNENLVGFYCTGQAAHVPKGNEFDVYNEKLIDIGIGVRPDLTGKGFGSQFFKFILGDIEDSTNHSAFRLTVAKFNSRAIRLYENFSFTKENEFHTERAKFITMVRRGNKIS